MSGNDMGALIEILLGAGIPLRIGLMIAMALVLGYFVYEQTKAKTVIFKAAIVVAIFVAFEIWITIGIFGNLQHPILIPPIVTLAILGGLFLLAFAGGMYMAERLDIVRRESRETEKKIIEEIKSNGQQNQ